MAVETVLLAASFPASRGIRGEPAMPSHQFVEAVRVAQAIGLSGCSTPLPRVCKEVRAMKRNLLASACGLFMLASLPSLLHAQDKGKVSNTSQVQPSVSAQPSGNTNSAEKEGKAEKGGTDVGTAIVGVLG